MPATGLKRGQDLFNRFRRKKGTTSQINFSAQSNPVDTYEQFCASGLDYKGQVSSGYVAKGVNIGVGVQLDILALIAAGVSGFPGIPGLSLTVGADVSASIKKETLIVLQRFPTWAYDRNVVNTLIGFQGIPPPSSYTSFRPLFSTGTPITVMAMDGKSVEAAIALSAGASLGLPFSIDELGVSLDVGISGSLSVKIISLQDPSPGCYASLSDLTLQTNLEGKLNQILNPEQISRSERMGALMSKISARLRSGRTPSPQTNSLNFFKLGSFSGNLGSFATASARFGMPEVLGIDLADTIRAQAGVGVGANLEAGLISYRFQSTNAGSLTLVSTQDTQITYRKFNANAGVFATLGLKELPQGRDYTNYSMTYQSFGRYWRYPTTPPAPNDTRPTHPLLNGSGLSFGMSVKTTRLINCAINPNDTSNLRLIACIAKQLRVHPKTVYDFIATQAAIGDIDPNQAGLPKYVFLEANFAFPSFQTMTLESDRGLWKPKDGFSDPKFNAFRTALRQSFPDTLTSSNWNAATLQSPNLEAIRLRFRMAETNSPIRTLFKLGIKPYVAIGINTELSLSTDTGREVLFDYYVQWFNNPEYNTNTKLYRDAEEFSVPPVVLLHQ